MGLTEATRAGNLARMANPVLEKRLDRLLTQTQVAELAGVSLDTVWRAEKGEPISALSQARIARALEQAREDLFPDEAA